MDIFFKRTKSLEYDIDQFLSQITKGTLLFLRGIQDYFKGDLMAFEDHLARLSETETQADGLRRNIEKDLYLHTLIPESRGDVLGLMESSDKVLNLLSQTLSQFSVELPDIHELLQKKYMELSELSCKSVDHMVQAIRAYFRDLHAVREAIDKAIFYEKETDRLAEEIKRDVFQMDIKLSLKFHHRYFALHIESISDEAENVCDRLAIAAIKRDM